MKRFLIVFMVLGLIAGSVATAEANTEPARSGTIVSGSGWLPEYYLGGCQTTPDCQAWLQSDCDPHLAGREPGVMASIVDVADLADGRTRRIFRYTWGTPAGLVWGGAVVQLWRQGCTEIRDSRWRSTDCDDDARGRDCTWRGLRIPTSAKWMTVTGYPDNVHLAWTLT